MTHLKAVCIVIAIALTGIASAQLPENPRPVADHTFWFMTSANAAATIGDIWTTTALIGPAQKCTYEAWNSGLYGRRPNFARTTAVMGGLAASSAVLSYELKKHNVHIWKVKLWAAPQAYLAYGHALGTINNLQTCR